MNRAKTYLVAAILFFILINASTALAGALPGMVEGTGTFFEVTDSPYQNISVESSESIKAMVQSIAKTVFVNIEPVSQASSTSITVNGLSPVTIYYRYEDSLQNLTEFTTDEFGSYTYSQDISETHLVIIKTEPSTWFIRDDITGGDCYLIGTWDWGNKTCTVTTDVINIIEIESDGITLDGGGHIFSTDIFANGRTGLTITNIDNGDVHPGHDEAGILLYNSSNTTIKGNKFSNRWAGMMAYNVSNSTIIENTFNSSGFGIAGGVFNNNRVVNNNFINNELHIYLFSANTGNVFNLAAPVGGNYWDDHDNTDADNDGFADTVYYFTGGVDNLPLAEPFSSQPQDETPPEITIVTPQAYSLYTVGTALEFSAEDSESGVANVSGELTNTAGETQAVETGFVPAPGVYTLVVSAEDNAGNQAVTEPVYFVVYDPSGGFATGGGWFHPDTESSLSSEGKANFGFVAKYRKGSSTGNLEFQYKDGEINLKSTSIDWLVISGTSAQLQGTGTINGEGLYTFRVRATDSGEPGAGIDHFDIKVWAGTDTEGEPIHSAKNVLSGGNIVVHKK
jgi:parallel beta-helix repeat protein